MLRGGMGIFWSFGRLWKFIITMGGVVCLLLLVMVSEDTKQRRIG